ncbi:dihydrolipoyl dehydrogenase family protein [Desemzia sp. FAM 23991]|uniref:dihydrolipoyl dehydrogenase family protein n=1 Tax=unclassified Desemzia TaxID=2685243 RepID=UPI00388A9440
MNNYQTDVAIIGFGKAGKTLAGALAKKGKTAIVIEKSPKMYGGTCINVGCLPTKSLTNSAKTISQLTEFGIERTPELNNQYYQKALHYKDDMVSKLNQKNYHKIADLDNVTVLDGFAAFKDEHTLSVDTGEEIVQVTAENIIINTGSVANIPDIDGISGNSRVYTSESILDLEQLPQRLAIIGSGYIGLEYASYFNGFGSAVTIFEAKDTFLGREDEDVAQSVLERMKETGIQFEFEAATSQIKETASGVTVAYSQNEGENEAKFDAVLLATGRKPNTEHLGTEKAGVALGEKGEVKVNANLQTTIEHIWAVGDVKGGPQFTYISLDDYRIVLPQLLGEAAEYSLDSRPVFPNATFIDPPLASVGMNEKAAKKAGLAYEVAKMPTANVPKAQVLRETAGFMKVLVDSETKSIIGATLFSAESHEMINLLALAINEKIPYTTLRDTIYTHPIMTEALNDLLGMIED